MGLASTLIGPDARYEVVMATYNGAAFVEAQLASILVQKPRPVRLLIRDDGSTDTTLMVLKRFAASSPVPIVVEAGCQTLGVTANFNHVLMQAREPYVFLADQDDLWDDDHVAQLFHQMGQLEECWGRHVPLLVHSDLRLISSQGELLSQSFFRRQCLDPQKVGWVDLLFQNVVTGCTVLLNRACLESALPVPQEALLHDGWLALVAAGLGHIGFLNQATVSYRQHGQNVVGAGGFLALLRRRWQVVLGSSRQAESFLVPFLRQADVFLGRYGMQLNLRPHASGRRLDPNHLAQALRQLAHPSVVVRIQSACRLGLRKHRWWRSLGLYWCLWRCRFLPANDSISGSGG